MDLQQRITDIKKRIDRLREELDYPRIQHRETKDAASTDTASDKSKSLADLKNKLKPK